MGEGGPGTDERIYPWGNTAPDATRANCVESECGDGHSETAPVGSFPAGASPYDVLDLAGNAWEWLEDDWHWSYDEAPDDGQAWVESPRVHYRVGRGGDWHFGPPSLRASYRNPVDPQHTPFYGSFRCCRSPER